MSLLPGTELTLTKLRRPGKDLYPNHSLSLSIQRLPLQCNGGFCFGQEFKGSPCFWQKKVEECQRWSKVEVLRTRKNCPRLLPRLVLCDQCAPVVQPGLPRLPRESPFSELFSTPAGLTLNLRTAIYNTALAPVVDIPPLSEAIQKRKAGKKTGRRR